jgi:hypothetical protein
MGTLGLRLPRWLGRVLGVGEAGLGSAALFVGGWLPALLVGVAYAGFLAVVVLMMRRGESFRLRARLAPLLEEFLGTLELD